MPTTSELIISRISAQDTVPLRHACLRSGMPSDTARFEGDDAATTMHFGASAEGQIIGVVSLYENNLPERPDTAALQLRGMAVTDQLRRRGVGRALLDACRNHCQERGIALLWCNARKTAVGFYSRMGFGVLGDEFSLPGIGPHYRMLKVVPKKA